MKITGTEKLKQLSARARSVPKVAERAMYRAINSTAGKVQTMAVKEITGQLNLQVSYVRGLFSISKAGPGRIEASVNARNRPMRLARFSAKQLTAPARHAKGDALRSIPSGRKAAGVSVKVSKAGGVRRMPKTFMIPLRAGNTDGGNGMGIFVRFGGKLKHLYGPSPAQLFKRFRVERAPDVSLMLAKDYLAQLRYELTGSRKV